MTPRARCRGVAATDARRTDGDALGLADVLGRPMHGVARVVLEHRRCERFRPIAFLEIGLGITCVVCLLPVILLILVFGEADIELPTLA